MTMQVQGKIKARARRGLGKVKARSRRDQGKVERQGQGKINVRLKQSNHNHNHNYDLMGFDTIAIKILWYRRKLKSKSTKSYTKPYHEKFKHMFMKQN